MAVLMTALRRKSTRFQEIQDSANTTMKNLGLDIQLQYFISDYLINTSSSLDAQAEFEQFENIVPPSYRS